MLNVLILFFLLIVSNCYADNISIPSETVDAEVSLSATTINQIKDTQAKLNKYIDELKSRISDLNSQLQDYQNQMDTLEANKNDIKKNLTALAKQDVPVKSAVDLLNSNPDYVVDLSVKP